ncbi:MULTISPECIES: Lrp/AsnC family transcriptional regulator [unclassified Microbacterium]|uniref:Lrp/AsnC family transcriptional regulator n=1 Tax=unclassified Microbacterium TaxID=2609290 RepID=UPI000EA93E3F|nr:MULTISPECIES: Lrp/AsnC family transcriptional regulator [unclassified Microbacterium]MBT2483298.1 Lrp/AsnC family transcriptional regulator [Microbacterium sp. ISL-108]RKN66336.1 Lrp/AsnC family transcriptional regulator [Microbacterium sp. CGR2]
MIRMETTSAGPTANTLRAPALDPIDARIVQLLTADGRMTNAELAGHLGVAPSTAHARLRALVDRGVITGFHASVDERKLGAGLQSVIGVSLRPSARRESIVEFADRVRALPQVIQVFFLGGEDDFLLHIAVADSSEMREFVLEHLSAQSSVASTRTSIVFDYHRNSVAASFH